MNVEICWGLVARAREGWREGGVARGKGGARERERERYKLSAREGYA